MCTVVESGKSKYVPYAFARLQNISCQLLYAVLAASLILCFSIVFFCHLLRAKRRNRYVSSPITRRHADRARLAQKC